LKIVSASVSPDKPFAARMGSSRNAVYNRRPHGCHLRSEGYERPTADVFAVEDEIARSVVDRLKVSLAELPQRSLVDRHTQNMASRAKH
jgi:hypothetical protein